MKYRVRILILVLGVVLSSALAFHCLAGEPPAEKKSNAMPAEAKTFALKLATALYLHWDADSVATMLDDKVTVNDGRAFKRLLLKSIKDIKQGKGGPFPSVEEIVFLKADKIAGLQKRFGKAGGIWKQDRVPKFLQKYSACLFVVSLLRPDGTEVKQLLHVYYFRKVDGVYKVFRMDKSND